MVSLQGSLFEPEQEERAWRPLAGARRTALSAGAWVDHLPSWLSPGPGGADDLFRRLADEVPWRAERRVMYDREVAVPRLLCFYGEHDALPHPLLLEAREALSRHYADELGEPFRTAGLCLYRDGRDSVAWHGDRIGRGRRMDTMVAILSLGETRRLVLRPDPERRVPGTTHSVALGHGDLVVMGGSCQRTWQHSVPKSTTPCGPRISIQFRTRGVL
jgi:alkylated DNA repair dioxygenase AlkB